MVNETSEERASRILAALKQKYPNAKSYDLDGRKMHFVCEIEPVSEHPDYDRAIEVIIASKPHKHLNMTQWYTILSGTLKFHFDGQEIILNKGDKYTVKPGVIHWAESIGNTECWLELYSEPGWTKDDHISVED